MGKGYWDFLKQDNVQQGTNESERAGRRRRRLTETIKIDPVGDHPRSHKERRISFLSVLLVHKSVPVPFSDFICNCHWTGHNLPCHRCIDQVWAIGLTRVDKTFHFSLINWLNNPLHYYLNTTKVYSHPHTHGSILGSRTLLKNHRLEIIAGWLVWVIRRHWQYCKRNQIVTPQ